ncbi:MAG: tetratricopeptide repeat protein [Phycisphaerales bacterium]|nr:MAG: tetratricopeptide repeat protein [Phycisphaerales bacterium]
MKRPSRATNRQSRADAWFNLGAVEAQRGNLAHARTSLKRVLNINPNHDEAKTALQTLEADK